MYSKTASRLALLLLGLREDKRELGKIEFKVNICEKTHVLVSVLGTESENKDVA